MGKAGLKRGKELWTESEIKVLILDWIGPFNTLRVAVINEMMLFISESKQILQNLPEILQRGGKRRYN